MNIDYSLVLLVLVLISGVIWLIDILVFAKIRKQKLHIFLHENTLNADELKLYLESAEQGEETKVNGKQKKLQFICIERIFMQKNMELLFSDFSA